MKEKEKHEFDTGRRFSTFDRDTPAAFNSKVIHKQGDENDSHINKNKPTFPSDVPYTDRLCKDNSFVDIQAVGRSKSERKYKQLRYGEDYRSTLPQSSEPIITPNSNGFLGSGSTKEEPAKSKEISSDASTFKSLERQDTTKRYEDLDANSKVHFKLAGDAEDSNNLISSFRRVQKSSTESCLHIRGTPSSGGGEDEFSKYYTSLEEQTRILADIESKNSNLTSTSSSNRELSSVPLSTLDTHLLKQTSQNIQHDKEYSTIADQLAVSVEEQAKILADIEREKKYKKSYEF